MQDVLRERLQPCIKHIDRNEGFFLEAVSTDHDNIAAERHADDVHRPDLRTMEQSSQHDLGHDDGENAQNGERSNSADPVIDEVDRVADAFDHFHFSLHLILELMVRAALSGQARTI